MGDDSAVQVLIMENGTHLDPESVRQQCPSMRFHTARNIDEALQRCAAAEVLLAMAHDVTDALISRMPRLRYLCALSAGIDRLETLTTLKPNVRVTSARGIHGPQMSELAFLFMIALSRNFTRMQRNQQVHVWQLAAKAPFRKDSRDRRYRSHCGGSRRSVRCFRHACYWGE